MLSCVASVCVARRGLLRVVCSCVALCCLVLPRVVLSCLVLRCSGLSFC